jgi:hypothetical protein
MRANTHNWCGANTNRAVQQREGAQLTLRTNHSKPHTNTNTHKKIIVALQNVAFNNHNGNNPLYTSSVQLQLAHNNITNIEDGTFDDFVPG